MTAGHWPITLLSFTDYLSFITLLCWLSFPLGVSFLTCLPFSHHRQNVHAFFPLFLCSSFFFSVSITVCFLKKIWIFFFSSSFSHLHTSLSHVALWLSRLSHNLTDTTVLHHMFPLLPFFSPCPSAFLASHHHLTFLHLSFTSYLSIHLLLLLSSTPSTCWHQLPMPPSPYPTTTITYPQSVNLSPPFPPVSQTEWPCQCWLESAWPDAQPGLAEACGKESCLF